MRFLSLFVLLTAVLFAAHAQAGQCAVTAIPMSFGLYDSISSFPTDARGEISVICSPDVHTIVRLDPGRNSGGFFNPRKMSGTGGYLNYNLYIDAARTQIWGDGTGITSTKQGANNLSVFGRIPPRQNVKAGVYNDFITVTVEW